MKKIAPPLVLALLSSLLMKWLIPACSSFVLYGLSCGIVAFLMSPKISGTSLSKLDVAKFALLFCGIFLATYIYYSVL